MTAANLGARVTGWGFVVFTVGAVAWIVVGAATVQRQLLWSNAFLLLVDLFGIWRWLGRRAKFSDTARSEERRSGMRYRGACDIDGDVMTRFSVAGLDGMGVVDRAGQTIAHVVDALVDCRQGAIEYLIVREGGIAGVGEKLRRLSWSDVRMGSETLATDLSTVDLARLPVAEPLRS